MNFIDPESFEDDEDMTLGQFDVRYLQPLRDRHREWCNEMDRRLFEFYRNCRWDDPEVVTLS